MPSVPTVLDPSTPHALTPEAGGPTFQLRVLRVHDRPAFRAAITAAGGRSWPQVALLRQLEAEVAALMDGEAMAESRQALCGTIAEFRAGIEASAAVYRAERSEAALKDLAEAMAPPVAVSEAEELVLSVGGTRYARMVGDNQVHAQVAGIVAAERFLVGWEGGGLPAFRRGPSGVPEDLLAHVQEPHLHAIGQEIERLLAPGADRLGNSRSASIGGSTPTPSPGGKAPPRKNPAKTPSSSDGSASTG